MTSEKNILNLLQAEDKQLDLERVKFRKRARTETHRKFQFFLAKDIELRIGHENWISLRFFLFKE